LQLTLTDWVEFDAHENLKLSLVADGGGHIEVRIELRTGADMQDRLQASFTVDQTALPPAIQILRRFARTSGSS
jgi:hypothetical protein